MANTTGGGGYVPTYPRNPQPPTPAVRGRAFRGLPYEMRALASEAYALWGQIAKERANPYSDHQGCLLAGRMAIDASAWEDGFVILDAIRERMDEKSSPRWIPEWSRDLGARRRENLRNDRRIAEREAVDDLDPEVRRVIVAISRAKAQGKRVSLSDHQCAVCGQFTEGRCPTCSRPLHQRSCPTRHECGVAA